MRYMKHLSVALIALGLSAPAFANNSVYVPSQKGGLKIAVDPLYLRNKPANSLSDSSFDWGTYAQIGYLFPATGNDLTVDYTYLRTGDKEDLDLDATNLAVGQRLTTGAFDIHLFSGLRYAHLNYALDASTPENKQAFSNLFHGFGPLMGVDARYQLGNCSCFGLDTHLNTSLLVGTVSARSVNNSVAIASSTNQIVPEVDAKLGIDYTYPIPCSKSVFGVEVGYQSSNYFNTFNTDIVGGSGNATFDGIYLDVKYYA